MLKLLLVDFKIFQEIKLMEFWVQLNILWVMVPLVMEPMKEQPLLTISEILSNIMLEVIEELSKLILEMLWFLTVQSI